MFTFKQLAGTAFFGLLLSALPVSMGLLPRTLPLALLVLFGVACWCGRQ
jgi:hypothetical protein